jgi:hypothetical protein
VNSKQPIQERLSQLWQEGARDFAISFLRRAMHADITLSELEAILHFDAVRSELKHIRLRDVMSQKAAPVGKPFELSEPASASRPSSSSAPAPLSRKRTGSRRSPKQTDAMKQLLLKVLADESAGLSTPNLCNKLQEGGFKADAPTATLLLRMMETSGELQSDNGRPKTWRLKDAGRRSTPASSMFIRKAHSSPTETEQ